MRKAGVANYEKFAREVLDVVKEKPISFEVFSDEFSEMRRQALMIGKWQENVYVKIPITNTRGDSALSLIEELSAEGVKLNVTAILTPEQVRGVAKAVKRDVPCVVSVFAGRVEAERAKRRIELDKYYVDHWSFWLDIYILFATVRAVLFDRDAY